MQLKQLDYAKGIASVAKGKILLETVEGEEWTTYRLVAPDGLKWEISHAAFDAFEHGRPYAVYYTPNSHKLLSIEPLSEV
jgi:hypothetical protein